MQCQLSSYVIFSFLDGLPLICNNTDMKTEIRMFVFSLLITASLAGCVKVPEMTEEEIARATGSLDTELISKTQSKPWKGGWYVPGKVGGTWYDTMLSDPKTFNQYIADRDGDSSALISQTTDFLFDYDTIRKEWKPRCAYFSVETNDKKGTLTVHCTLRENMYWTYYGSNKKIPVTSDDAVFWYDGIAGDKRFQNSGYPQQFVMMRDGTEKHIDIIKIDDRRFDFVFPRIVAEPLLAVNMSLCPSFIYRPAKEKGGVDGIKNLFSVASDPKLLPSMGRWYITEYAPAQRIVLRRNPYYWDKDTNGVTEPYPEQQIIQIVGDENTDYLLFKQGKAETYTPRPENVNDVVNNQKDEYTVFNAEGSLSAPFWSFNQNPKNKEKPYYSWFTQKEFRQAMSCLLNRDRIIIQTYRGLAEPKYSFFPEANPYYNPEITLQYRYDPVKAVALLKKCGMKRNDKGIMCDANGIPVEFDLSLAATSTVANDIAQIITDECAKVGVKVNVRQIDFQKLVESLTASYDWQSVIITLGVNLFPSQGSNVWASNGNLHLWYPLQEKPATEWEARVDYLYNEGCYTSDHAAASGIWDEYQKIILEQCPIIYLVRSRSFFAVRNKWDFANVYYDNLNGAKTDYVFLRQ
jgi:peptide/nickel transport system substrate-binding protein